MKLIGLNKQLKELENFIRNYGYLTYRVAILYGACGTGKTSSVYYLAEKLGYEVVEFNASDDRTYEFFRTHVKPACCNPSFSPTIVLLDEFEDVSFKAQQYFAKFIDRAVKPVVLTTNDISSIFQGIRKKALEIFYPKPQIEHVVKYAQQKGFKDFAKIKNIRDFRQLEMVIEHGSDVEAYQQMFTQKERILTALKTGNYIIIEDADLPIILDTVCAHVNGVELWRFVEALRVYDLTKNPRVLEGLKLSVKDIVNSFYAKLEESKKKEG
jgi:replication-associated recombination protein RarA